MSAFERLHPALQYHIASSLGWKRLRPLQEESIDPILRGEHALLIAPTAGGKTEAAFFPLLSRILSEEWHGLSVLYVCPLRALLNNLHVRLESYCSLVGRRAGLWHGDTGPSERTRILEDPPDVLLITPESLEVILILRRGCHEALFRQLRAVVIDEIHAFAGDDRGWHLLAVLERIGRFAERDLQRLGLSATVGEPQALLRWLAGSSSGAGRVIAPCAPEDKAVAVMLDHVGSLRNAATVISRLHRGEKRLVFVDSRDRVEQLAADLLALGVETFVSHGSLGREERHRAEAAFAEGQSCVIVATSTLELGIDVGDLDRVIQIDSPGTVASFLQRLGRTGRRPGTVRNCLFLATNEEALIEAAGLLELWGRSYVEPVSPPVLPFHILAQQIMAVALQEGGTDRQGVWDWLGGMPAFACMPEDARSAIVAFMLAQGILSQDRGMLWLGEEGEEAFGRRSFMELFAVFSTPPLIAVRHGRKHLGEVDVATFAMRHEEVPVLLLGGRSWTLASIDWDDRIAYVEPAPEGGRSRWLGAAQPLHYAFCQAIRRVLAGTTPGGGRLSKRAEDRLARVRLDFRWLAEGKTAIVGDGTGHLTWWTFAGLLANAALAAELAKGGLSVGRPDNFRIPIQAMHGAAVVASAVAALREIPAGDFASPVQEKVIDDLKFSVCLPMGIAMRMLEERLTDREAVRAVLAQETHFVRGCGRDSERQ
ncbi:MAG: DEAD/DEAH box helicase [Candidatus Schekmanbacteria bacterium]|nr:DEAD/DEAH box helicase [Candidatus Schekmanbacteria bacterium]